MIHTNAERSIRKREKSMSRAAHHLGSERDEYIGRFISYATDTDVAKLSGIDNMITLLVDSSAQELCAGKKLVNGHDDRLKGYAELKQPRGIRTAGKCVLTT